jgi:putative selenium metabolism hydrolase
VDVSDAMSVDPVDVAARLIGLGCLSGHEGPMAEAVAGWMNVLGYRDIRTDRLGSVVGVVGPESDEFPLLFDGHMDVVPPAGDWGADPFGGIVRDGRLYGRGATDMKGGLAATLVGVAAAAPELERPVAVSATVLEETVEGVALAEVLDTVQPKAVVICEPTGLGIRVGQRGRAELLLTALGVPAHAASPERGRNPVLSMAAALGRIAAMDLPSDDALGPAIVVPTDTVSDPYPSISLIPSSVTVRFDRRTLLDEKPEDVIDGLLAAAGAPGEEFTARISRDPVTTYTGVEIGAERFLRAWRLDERHPLAMATIAAVEGAALPAQLGVWGFCTNGSESMGARGIPTVGFGPGWPEDAHVVDESVSVDEIRKASEVYRRLAIGVAREA